MQRLFGILKNEGHAQYCRLLHGGSNNNSATPPTVTPNLLSMGRREGGREGGREGDGEGDGGGGGGSGSGNSVLGSEVMFFSFDWNQHHFPS